MNSQIDPQSPESALARVDYRETEIEIEKPEIEIEKPEIEIEKPEIPGVTYKYNRGAGWKFSAGNYTLTVRRALGKERAEKVAAQIAGGMKRTRGRGIDNLARAGIARIEFA